MDINFNESQINTFITKYKIYQTDNLYIINFMYSNKIMGFINNLLKTTNPSNDLICLHIEHALDDYFKNEKFPNENIKNQSELTNISELVIDPSKYKIHHKKMNNLDIIKLLVKRVVDNINHILLNENEYGNALIKNDRYTRKNYGVLRAESIYYDSYTDVNLTTQMLAKDSEVIRGYNDLNLPQ